MCHVAEAKERDEGGGNRGGRSLDSLNDDARSAPPLTTTTPHPQHTQCHDQDHDDAHDDDNR